MRSLKKHIIKKNPRDVIVNRAKDYYEDDKKRLKNLARDKYRNLSAEEKKKRRENMKKRDTLICLKKRKKH